MCAVLHVDYVNRRRFSSVPRPLGLPLLAPEPGQSGQPINARKSKDRVEDARARRSSIGSLGPARALRAACGSRSWYHREGQIRPVARRERKVAVVLAKTAAIDDGIAPYRRGIIVRKNKRSAVTAEKIVSARPRNSSLRQYGRTIKRYCSANRDHGYRRHSFPRPFVSVGPIDPQKAGFNQSRPMPCHTFAPIRERHTEGASLSLREHPRGRAPLTMIESR